MDSSPWQFYLSPRPAWQAVYADCAAAKYSIDVEEYILLNDEAGKPLFDILKQKAQAGVSIRLLIDSAGSFSTTHSYVLLNELRTAGVKVKIFNHIEPRRLNSAFAWFLRDHRKIIVIDNIAAHIGGVCFEAAMADWRDTQIRITGPILPEFKRVFEEMWKKGTKGRYARFKKGTISPDGFQVLVNAPRFLQRYVYHELLNRIRSATERIWITTPYFIPNYRFYRALRRAVQRGVDVRLLVADRSDHPFVDRASDFHVGPALQAGIKVYRYFPAILHAKSAVIDDWATIGSCNIDNLSFLLNHEANLVGTNPQFVQGVIKIFVEDIKNLKHMVLDEWLERPWTAKMLEFLTWPLHRVM
jgi:cardiolipin synthase